MRHFVYARLRQPHGSAIHVVRVRNEILETSEIDDLAERLREPPPDVDV